MESIRLGELAEVRSGSVALPGRGALYLQGRNITSAGISLKSATPGTPPVRVAARARLVADDILVNSRGSQNRAARVPCLEVETYASLDVVVVRVTTSALLPAYLAAFLNLPSTQSELAEHRTTAVLPRVPIDAFTRLRVPLPSLQRQEAIAGLFEASHKERELIDRITGRRQRLLDEILRLAAEDEPMPSYSSAWASNRSGDTAAGRAGVLSTLQNGVSTMPKSAGSNKGGGTRHVVPAPGGGWNNLRGGASRASGHYDTKQEAVDAARQQSRNEGSELKIHNRDGRIAQSDSHGNDPNPPKC